MTRFTSRVLAFLALTLVLTSCGSDATGVITPPPPPPTTFNVAVTACSSTGTAPLTACVTITTVGTATGPVAYHVSFGDATLPVDSTLTQAYWPTHVWATPGTYTVSVSAVRDGITATSSTTVLVQTPTLNVAIGVSPSTGFAPLPTNLACLATGTADGPLSYHFHFGDNTPDTTVTTSQSSATIAHTYVDGRYPASCSAERDGLTATSSPTTVVAELVPPVGTRSTIDRPDEVFGAQLKFAYMVPQDGTDLGRDTDGSLVKTIEGSMAYIAGYTGGKVERIDTYMGQPDMLYRRMALSEADITDTTINAIADELRDGGFLRDTSKRWVVYYDGAANIVACGQAEEKGRVSVIFLHNCGGASFMPNGAASGWETTMLHETCHMAGCVDPLAPDYLSANHDDLDDLMSPSGGFGLDPQGRNYYGDNVPAGVFNWKLDPIWIQAPAGLVSRAMAMQSSLRATPQQMTNPVMKLDGDAVPAPAWMKKRQ